jgi:hypothetical protein
VDTWSELSVGNLAMEPFSRLGGIGQAVRVFGGEQALNARMGSLNRAVYGGSVGRTSKSGTTDYNGDATLP